MEKHHAFWWAIIVVAGLFTGLYGVELLELSRSTQLQLSSSGDSLTGFAVSDGVTGYATLTAGSVIDLSDGKQQKLEITDEKKYPIKWDTGEDDYGEQVFDLYIDAGADKKIKVKITEPNTAGSWKDASVNIPLKFNLYGGDENELELQILGGKHTGSISFNIKWLKPSAENTEVHPTEPIAPIPQATCPVSLSNYDVNKDGETDINDLTELNAQLGSPLISSDSCPAKEDCPVTSEVTPDTEETILPECTKAKQYELMKTGSLNSICFVEPSGKSYWKACTSQGDTYGNYLCVNTNWQDISGIGKVLGSAPKTGTATTPAPGVCTLGDKGTGANAVKVCDGTKFVACDASQHQKAYGKYYCNQNIKAWAECGAGNYKEGYVVASKKYVCIKSTKGTFSWEDITGIGKILGSSPKTGGTTTTATVCKTESDCKKNVKCKGQLIGSKYCVWSLHPEDVTAETVDNPARKGLCAKVTQCITKANVCTDLNKKVGAFICGTNNVWSEPFVASGVSAGTGAAVKSKASVAYVNLKEKGANEAGWLHIGNTKDIFGKFNQKDPSLNLFPPTSITFSNQEISVPNTALQFTLPYFIGDTTGNNAEVFFTANALSSAAKIQLNIFQQNKDLIYNSPSGFIVSDSISNNVGKEYTGVSGAPGTLAVDGGKKYFLQAFGIPMTFNSDWTSAHEGKYFLEFQKFFGTDDFEIKDMYVKTGIVFDGRDQFGDDKGTIKPSREYPFRSTTTFTKSDSVRLRFFVYGINKDTVSKVKINGNSYDINKNNLPSGYKEGVPSQFNDFDCQSFPDDFIILDVTIDPTLIKKGDDNKLIITAGKNSKGNVDNFLLDRIEVVVNENDVPGKSYKVKTASNNWKERGGISCSQVSAG